MNLHTLARRIGLASALLVTAYLAGCATAANSGNMTIATADATAARKSTPDAMKTNVAIREVSGGKDTNPLWMSNVGSADFERALEDSLRSVGMLSTDRQSGRYQIVAQLAKLDQPLLGLDMTVTSNVTYKLIERATGKSVWEKSIATPYTAKMSDAFVGTERLRLANEGAIRQNISQLIGELQQIKVAGVTVR